MIMSKKDKPSPKLPDAVAGYDAMLGEVVSLLESARHGTVRVINAVITATYWEIGRRIVRWEQGGKDRSQYGDRLLEKLALDLTRHFGKGFSRENLRLMRKFYQTYTAKISQTPSGKSPETKSQIPSGKSPELPVVVKEGLPTLAIQFPLPWSHYVRLLSVKNAETRRFYEAEALHGGWSVKQLNRQIASQFYERTLLSKNKAAMLTKGQKPRPEDDTATHEQIKDPFVLEFLDLKDEYSETDLEEALIRHLETFLLELGGDFSFVGRQRRLRIGHQWFRIDLLFFHRKLRCLVIIDLKIGELTHADAGQMHLYCNYAAEHWTNEGENPPVGLILCAESDAAVAHYALENLPNKILAAEYKMKLPDEKTLADEIEKTRKRIESHATARRRETGK
jgi:predicted nuclease of restriction endonuclease-like (RecB) superfamily